MDWVWDMLERNADGLQDFRPKQLESWSCHRLRWRLQVVQICGRKLVAQVGNADFGISVRHPNESHLLKYLFYNLLPHPHIHSLFLFPSSVNNHTKHRNRTGK